MKTSRLRPILAPVLLLAAATGCASDSTDSVTGDAGTTVATDSADATTGTTDLADDGAATTTVAASEPASSGDEHDHERDEHDHESGADEAAPFDLAALDGQWISEAAFVGADSLDPLYERMAELNPGHDAASARQIWEDFRATDWTSLEIAAPDVTFLDADSDVLCDGPFTAVGSEKVDVSSWSSDAQEIAVNVFEFDGDPEFCDDNFRIAWFIGAGEHAHMRNAATIQDATAPGLWWPALLPDVTTSDDYAASLANIIEQNLAGAFPPIEN